MNSLLALLVFSALIASVNPCTMSVLIMSVASLVGKGKNPRHVGLHTMLFGIGVFITYASIGTVLLFVFTMLPITIVGYIAVIVAFLICIFGLLEIKDYFWYGSGLSFKLSAKSEKKIHAWTKKHHSHIRGLLLGMYTALKLSHYTAILLVLAALIASLLANGSLYLSVIWAFWYVLPILFIATLAATGANPHNLLSWKEQTKHTMRLSIGLLYVLLGWLVLVLLAGGLKLV